MKKKRKKKHQSEESSSPSSIFSPVKDSVKAFNWKLLAIIVINTIIIFTFYRLMLNFYYFEFVMGGYLLIAAGFIFAYFIYNRGMSRRHITPDMLPTEWSKEQKDAYIADGQNRLRKSKWMLTIIFPLILTFMFDCIELFWGDMFARWFH